MTSIYDIDYVRDQFPALQKRVGDRPAIFFDGPAPSQRNRRGAPAFPVHQQRTDRGDFCRRRHRRRGSEVDEPEAAGHAHRGYCRAQVAGRPSATPRAVRPDRQRGCAGSAPRAVRANRDTVKQWVADLIEKKRRVIPKKRYLRRRNPDDLETSTYWYN